ncbi:MAG TPA: S-adenosylmethionine:tRNA ribosyltransferase-isomerase [Marmoricola sp.]|nr:S-adenosylmethionine:tRNA ribosyltransferase-isomerase [Marmoricola sp.]
MRTLEEQPTIRFAPPPGATAPAPAEARGLPRDGVRLLVATPDGLTHGRFADLPDHLRAGDLLVVNDSATEARQLDARRAGPGDGQAVVVHLAMPLDDGSWVVELRTAPHADRAVLDARPRDRIIAGPVAVTLLRPWPSGASSPTGAGNRLWRARVTGPLSAWLREHGRPISYGYLDRSYPLADYQTVFSVRPGSAEMPSAARPFTDRLVTTLVSRGVAVAPITLHTGVSSQEGGEAPQPEWFEVPAGTARLVEAVRAGHGRVVAVGTTVTRALESAVVDGHVVARRGWTDRVVTPKAPPRVVTGLVTGWHDPQASHLLLVEAVAGPRLAQRAYDAAAAEGYRWHEFGDSALFLP